MNPSEKPSVPRQETVSDIESQEKIPLRDAERYQELIDPSHTLPHVKILEHPPESTPSEVMFCYRFNIFNEFENEIGSGEVYVSRPDKAESTAFLGGIRIDEMLRGGNYGRSAYLELVKRLATEKIRLQSGGELSRGSKAIWDWLVEKGAAQKLSEGETDEETDNASYSTADYEII